MALAGTQATCGGKSSSGKQECDANLSFISKQISKKQQVGMEFGSDWTRHWKSSPFTTLDILSSSPFMLWLCNVSLREGFHELL